MKRHTVEQYVLKQEQREMFNKRRLQGILSKYSNYGLIPGMLDHAKRSSPEKNKDGIYLNTVMSTECTVTSPVKEERKYKEKEISLKKEASSVLEEIVSGNQEVELSIVKLKNIRNNMAVYLEES